MDSRTSILYITFIIAAFSLSFSLYSKNYVSEVQPCLSGDHNLKRSVEQIYATPTTEDEIVRLKGLVQNLMQTLISYSTNHQQSMRVTACSGISEVRSGTSGTQPYHQVLQTGNNAPFGIHNHANYRTTMGMGEFAAVLNGVEFWTRHNDYLLAKPDTTKTFGATKLLDLPSVPPSVTSKPTVTAQVEEMREYFKAWTTQNVTHRDYVPYFKPILCYLEGGWLVDSDLTESFASDTSSIDAATWKSLSDKLRFLLAGGKKHDFENIPFLPTALHDISIQENYFLKSSSNKPIMAKYLTDLSPREAFTDGIRSIVVGDKLTVYLVQTTAGLYLNIIFGKQGLQSGGATLSVTCNSANNAGCKSANAAGDRCSGEQNGCAGFVDGSKSGLKFTWNWPGEWNHPGIVYGPLAGPCFSVSLSVTGATGVSGYVVRPNSAGPNITGDFSQPIVIEGCVSDPTPVLANWDYRVLCVPLDKDIKLNRFRVVDDTSAQMAQSPPLSAAELATSRNAYFQLNPEDSDWWYDGARGYEYLDTLMETIPGRDNYGGRLEEKVGYELSHYYDPKRGPMNTAFYSRFYTILENDAMGRSSQRRGYNDPFVWAAMTSQPQVASLGVADPVTGDMIYQKWTYAIPLEIIYTTPLTSWNPYNLNYFDKGASAANIASITANGRNGGFTQETAYAGTAHEKYFFWTPEEFFGSNSSVVTGVDDTSVDTVGVLDKNGVVRKVRASGHWITFPEIAGVGKNIRQRYPIAPLSTDKNPGLKNSKALKHLLATNQKQLLDAKLGIGKPTLPLWTNPSTAGTRHFHRVSITASNIDRWNANSTAQVVSVSEQEAGHTHQLTLRRSVNPNGGFLYTVIDCDGAGPVCPDGHTKMCLTDNSC